MFLQGKLKKVFDTQQITNSFKKREFVVTTIEQYPQDILIEFTQDKCDVLNSYEAGQTVKVEINLKGREWINPEGVAKYFNTIQAWRIEKINDSQDNFDNVHNTPSQGEEDDLPF